MILIYSPKNHGGVRRVSENLRDGFNILGVPCQVAYGFKDVLSFIFYNGMKSHIYIGSLGGGIFSFFFPKSILILHGFASPYHYGLIKFLIISLLTKLFSSLSSYTVSVSSFTKMINEFFLGIRVNSVIYNSYSMANFDLSNDVRKKTILYAGRLIKNKRVLEILESFKLLPKDNNYELIFVGDGEYKNKLEELSLGYRVQFTGEINDDQKLSELYSNAEIFISLNEGEPFGIVFLEAMHHHLKIIAPVTGGQREFIPHDYPAFYVKDCADPESIASSLSDAINTPYIYNNLNKLKHYTPSYMASKYLELLSENN